MGASEGLQSLFSYSSDLVLPHLVSSWECLEVSASLSINWTTLYCMVLVSSCRSLSLAHFLPRTLDSLLFTLTHSFSLLSLSTWCFGICSLIMLTFLYSSPIMGLILHSLVDSPDSISNSIFSLQKGERQVFTFTPFFFRCSPLPPDHSSLLSLCWK